MITAYIAPNEKTSPLWGEAFAKGCGGKAQINGPINPGPFALFGSPQLWSEFVAKRDDGRTWYYGDHAFFGRKEFFRCAKNAMQFDGRSGDDDPRRFKRFNIPVKDWRKTGSHVLLCPNTEPFLKLHGFAEGQWVAETTAKLKQHTSRPIRLRWRFDATTLQDDLKGCWAVVTFTSNAAVEAALAGVPVFCTAPCAGLTMGSDDLSKIETPLTPDGREQWAARLANNQWTLNEMARGDLWRAIGI